MNLGHIACCTLVAAIAAPLAMLAPTAPAGELWPQRTVRIIVPFAAGTDAPARQLGEQLAKRWKQPVVIANRTGAEGLLGVAAFTAMRDDQTLMFHSAASTTT